MICHRRIARKVVTAVRSEVPRFTLYRRGRVHSALLILVLLAAAPLAHGQAQSGNPQKEIQVVLDRQVVAWNRGDLEGFMAGYWKSADFVYLSNKTVVRGWQTMLDRYRQLFQPPNENNMGILSLPEEEILMLGRDSAIVWGTFIVRTSDGKGRGGLYTLVMRRLPQGWRTVYDRTSLEPQPQASSQ
jgi:hypothetical protein